MLKVIINRKICLTQDKKHFYEKTNVFLQNVYKSVDYNELILAQHLQKSKIKKIETKEVTRRDVWNLRENKKKSSN